MVKSKLLHIVALCLETIQPNLWKGATGSELRKKYCFVKKLDYNVSYAVHKVQVRLQYEHKFYKCDGSYDLMSNKR